MSNIYKEDLTKVLLKKLPWNKLENTTVLITGGTGLIGSCLIDLLMQYGKLNVICTGRDKDKAKKRFLSYLNKDNFKFIEYDLLKKFNFPNKIDYIIHMASGAHPKEFSNNPVETMTGNFLGTYNLLEYAKDNGIKRFLYVSSGEVYGEASTDNMQFTEDYSGYINPVSIRSCYPISKRASETLSISYMKEYNVDVVIARPCHIYGPTMTKEDSRVVAQLINSALNNKDLVLKSDGLTMRSHCYVVDCVSAIMYILLCGASGEAYNIASNTSESILDFAKEVSKVSKMKIVFDIKDNNIKRGRAVLNSDKLHGLGWSLDNTLAEGIKKTIEIMKGTGI